MENEKGKYVLFVHGTGYYRADLKHTTQYRALAGSWDLLKAMDHASALECSTMQYDDAPEWFDITPR